MLVNTIDLLKRMAYMLSAIITAVTILACVFINGRVFAQSNDQSFIADFGLVQCGPTDQFTYSTPMPAFSEGDVYLKTNAAGLKTKIQVYVQEANQSSCKKIGTVMANDKTWTRLGAAREYFTNQGTMLILVSENLGADAYASVATILLTPTGLCQEVKNACLGEFEGNKGVVEVVNMSEPGEFVAVQTIPDISSENIMYVEYYDGGNFLYVTNSIEDVRRQYLRGGDRTVKKVVYLTNNRLFTVTEKVAMPKDPLYSQYLKSTFYRLGSQTKVVVILIGSVVLLFLGITAIRRFHAWRTYRNGHGIETYLRIHHQ